MADYLESPLACVWEVTMGCNMRCMHCGSSCKTSLPGELSTAEALDLIDQMKEVGLRHVTLSGGEPTIRKDIFTLTEKLSDCGIDFSIISNGWLLDERTVEKARNAHVTYIAMSLDGLEGTHDTIRKRGAFARVIRSLRILKANGLKTGIITTVNKLNLHELPAIGSLLVDEAVDYWQLQLALPMGNMKSLMNDMVAEPRDISTLLDYAYEFVQSHPNPQVFLADDIGYYTTKELAIKERVMSSDDAIWPGCGAGKTGFGILHNGDVVPCTSLRNPGFVEGNIRIDRLTDIWNHRFARFRDFTEEQLTGFCSDCAFSPVCLGGCSNSRYCLQGSINADNPYCVYSYTVQTAVNNVPIPNNIVDARKLIEQYSDEGNYQVLNAFVQRLLPEYVSSVDEHTYLLNILAYTFFRLGLFDKAVKTCQSILIEDPKNIQALHGLGLSLCELGMIEEGQKQLYECINQTECVDMEPFKDLLVLLMQEGNLKEADKVLSLARMRDPGFALPETISESRV